MKHADFRLKRPVRPNLVERDFDEFNGDLDAQSAWKHFGLKTLLEAYTLFLSNAFYYGEDFMWMGARAFDYYFPVLDEYLRRAEADDEWDDREAEYLGTCVVSQFEMLGKKITVETQAEIANLAEFVLDNLGLYAPRPKAQGEIRRSWKAVQAKLK